MLCFVRAERRTAADAVRSQALNKGEKPPIIAGRIEVQELHMGTVVISSPDLPRPAEQSTATAT